MLLTYSFNKTEHTNLGQFIANIKLKENNPDGLIDICLSTKGKLISNINYCFKLNSWLDHYKYIGFLSTLIAIQDNKESIRIASIDTAALLMVMNNKIIRLGWQDDNIKHPMVSLEFNESNSPGLIDKIFDKANELLSSARTTNLSSIDDVARDNTIMGKTEKAFILNVLAEGYNREIDDCLFKFDTSHDGYDLYTTDKYIKIVVTRSNTSIVIRNDPYSIMRFVKFLTHVYATFTLEKLKKIKLCQVCNSSKLLTTVDNIRLTLADKNLKEFDESDNNFIGIDNIFIDAIHSFSRYLFKKYR